MTYRDGYQVTNEYNNQGYWSALKRVSTNLVLQQVIVLGVLNLVGDLEKVASDDTLGRKLQDIKLISKR